MQQLGRHFGVTVRGHARTVAIPALEAASPGLSTPVGEAYICLNLSADRLIMTSERTFPPLFSRIGALALLAAVLTGCASGPKYGAAKKRKKGCDCPHWNRVPERGHELRAATMKLNGPPPTADGARN